jgi:hypothetical protein
MRPLSKHGLMKEALEILEDKFKSPEHWAPGAGKGGIGNRGGRGQDPPRRRGKGGGAGGSPSAIRLKSNQKIPSALNSPEATAFGLRVGDGSNNPRAWSIASEFLDSDVQSA